MKNFLNRGVDDLNMKKYRTIDPIKLRDRAWPNRVTTKAPTWCSVDLRDGNQALIDPMGSAKKHRFFDALVKMGYKEIEVGFPSASSTEYSFVRELIEKNRIPSDVTIQVLVQAREPLIKRTFDVLRGCKNAIVHLYNSTSELQRRIVFKKNKKDIKNIAINGALVLKEYSKPLIQEGCNIRFEYSPESFTQTELPYALEVCESVLRVLEASECNPVIINLPATVEVSTPNIYADQIEWMSKNFSHRDRLILSLHTHNDRGTGVAATELGLLAGAERVEGTLFGNGERTGNVCLATLGLNMLTQNIDPGIDFSHLEEMADLVTYCTGIAVHERHPYAGKLVYTAFSGSHQDAINKGFRARDRYGDEAQDDQPIWDVPYLPIDPKDVGRSYEAIIRINSQSGKGGIAYVLETDYGIKLPKAMQQQFSQYVQKLSDETGREVNSKTLYRMFCDMYLGLTYPYKYKNHLTKFEEKDPNMVTVSATIQKYTQEISISGRGNGPVEAFMNAMRKITNANLLFLDYSQHAIGAGEDTTAMAYVQMQNSDKKLFFGVGKDPNTTRASLKAILCAFNRVQQFP